MSGLSGPSKRGLLALGPGSKIKSSLLCERTAEFIVRHREHAPVKVVSANTFIRRVIPTGRLDSPLSASKVFSKPGGDSNRMDGQTPMGDTRPACYFALDTEAASAEALHYSGRAPKVPIINFQQIRELTTLWVPQKTVVSLKVEQEVVALDLRRDHPEAMAFLQEMNRDAGIQEALHKSGMRHILEALSHDSDYSAARGAAFAADRGLNLDGMAWNTARISQHADRLADNLSIHGTYLLPIRQVRPVATQEYFLDPRTGEIGYIARAVDPTVKIEDVPLFPEGTNLGEGGAEKAEAPKTEKA